MFWGQNLVFFGLTQCDAGMRKDTLSRNCFSWGQEVKSAASVV